MPEEPATIKSLQNEVDKIRDLMVERIDKMLIEQERIEDLIGKTEDLKKASKVFKKSARNIRKEMWKRNMKLKLLMLLGLAAIGLLLTMVILGSTGMVATPTVLITVMLVFAAVAAVFYVARLTSKVRYAKDTLEDFTNPSESRTDRVDNHLSLSPFNKTSRLFMTQSTHNSRGRFFSEKTNTTPQNDAPSKRHTPNF